MSERVLIIGGGLGGLFSGAILAKEGMEVTVLEKNASIGGGMQSFTRFGEVFDTGMHVLGGLQEGGNVRRLCQFLGIWDKVHVRAVPSECSERIFFAEDGRSYEIASGREGFVASLARHFPVQRDCLVHYVEALYRIVDEMDLFHLRPSADNIPKHSEEFGMPADAFIAKYISDRRLRQVVAYVNSLYGGRADETPAFVHAAISVLHINGTYRFAGGSHLFAETLADVIKDNGGRVIAGDGVCQVCTEGRRVTGVMTEKGRRIDADYYISDVHPCTLLSLMDDPKAFPKAYRTRLNEIPGSYSSFLLYLKLKPECFPYLDYTGYYIEEYDKIWDCADATCFLYMTPPEISQGKFSRKMIIASPMQWEEVSRWEETAVGHRGSKYEAWKQAQAEVLLRAMEKMFPGFRSQVEAVNAASPLTIRDYFGNKEGAMYGFAKDCRHLELSQVPVVTKIPNLLLTGQCVNLHGFCGVPLTAISTCEAILGKNYVLNKI